MNCEIVDANIQVKKENFPSSFIDRMNNDGVNDNPHDILQWLNTLYQNPDKVDEEIKGDLEIALIALSDMSENSFSLTDLLRNLDNSLIEVGAQNNPFGPLRQNFVSALKKIAYIKSVTPQSHSGIDEEYELCSPDILIVPFASQLYSLELNARNDIAVSVDMAKSSYQLTAFDRQIGWSRMLEMLDVFPSYLSNPTRAYVK